MQEIFSYVRYVVFGIFIICSAIIASVAVWNMSFTEAVTQVVQVDSYLIFLGAAGLVLIFAIIFIELARKNALTSRLWFECLWTGLFSVMELAGAASFSSIAPSHMCSRVDTRTVPSSCSSTRALMAFTWLCTILLLFYSFILIISCVIRSLKDPQIWHTTMRSSSLFGTSKLQSQPSSPTPRAIRNPRAAPSIKAPQPRRPPAAANFYNHRSGLSPDYQIEHFQPEIQYINQESARQESVSQIPNTGYISLYPQVIQPAQLSRTNTRIDSFQSQRISPSDDGSPVVNWPRANVMSQPVSPRKSKIHSQGSSQAPRASDSFDETRGSQRSRPTGPRTRGSSDARRPPPLDLSNISTYRDRDNPQWNG